MDLLPVGTDAAPWAWLALCLAGVVAVLAVVLWSVKRHRDPRLSLKCDQPVERLLPSLAGLTHGTLLDGNAVTLYENGAFFDALFGAIAEARHTVHFETFLWKPGALSQRTVQALTERARAGVTVRVLLDAQGAKLMHADERRRLQSAGCKVVRYHARRLRNLGVLNRRDHRKIAVVDGTVAFVGGHCIVDEWLGDGQDRHHYRDLGLRLTGPAVHGVQSAFGENWVAETGELFPGQGSFPVLPPVGDVAVHVARAKPERAAPAVKILHHLMLCLAQRRLWIQNPYFLPQEAAIEAFGAAVARGVDVRVMVPSAEVSDMPLVQHAAHHGFERLLKAGVRLFEYRRTLLHQKVLTVDSLWSGIGSSNFDDRSFEINDEITLGLHDPAVARQLEAIFERDMQLCHEWTLADWQRRRAWQRLRDRACYQLKEQL
jgi:cardiolipin synthase